jgi:hypothetical protein
VAISVLQSDLDGLARQSYVVGLNRLVRRQLPDRARAHVEACPMSRALDFGALELALVQRATIMCAKIIDRVELAIDVAYGYFMIADLKDSNPLRRNI